MSHLVPKAVRPATVVVTALAVVAVAALGGVSWSAAHADQQRQDEPPTTLRVATKEIVPFVFVDGDRPTGFSVDVWEDIAQTAGFETEWLVVDSVGAQLEAVEQGDADAALGAISRTAEREERLDFSYAYYNSGIQIMTVASESAPLEYLLSILFSPRLLLLYLFVILTLALMGHVVWLVERKRNDQFPRSYAAGVWEGIWWAGVTVTTVGYGDRTVKGTLGRVVALVWMFLGIFLVANFTAVVTSELTSARIEADVSGVEDLAGRRIATVTGTTSADYLRAMRLDYRPTRTAAEAVDLLRAGHVDAVVYDEPVLRHEAGITKDARLELVGELLTREAYAIALPPGSPHRESINASMLRLIEDGRLDDLLQRWSLAASP